MIKVGVVIFFVFLSFLSISQRQWTLPECIEYAQQNNIELRMQELGLEIQEQNVLQSKLNLLPNLNANASSSYNWGKTVDRFTNEFADSRVASVNLYLQSSVTLFRGFQLLNTIKRQNLELLSQRQDMQTAIDMKSMEITTAYLQILYGKENLQSREQQVKLTQMLVDRTKQLVEAGTLAEGDLINMKAQLASDQSLKIQAINDLNIAYLNLKQLMDLPADTIFDIVSPVISLPESYEKILPAETIYNFASENRPEIQSALTRLQRSEADLQISKSAYYPSLNLSAGWGTGYSGANQIVDGLPVLSGYYPNGNFTNAGDTVFSPSFSYNLIEKPFMDQFDENRNYSVGLYLTIPIFNNYQTKTQTASAKLAVQQAELQAEKAKRDIRKTIEQAHADALAALNSLEAAKLNLQALQEAFNYASKKYEAGMISSYDYNDAKIKFETSQNNLINAKYNYVFRIKVLDFYYGKPLSF